MGGGISAVELRTEIAEVAARVTWVAPRPPRFTGGEFTAEHGRRASRLWNGGYGSSASTIGAGRAGRSAARTVYHQLQAADPAA